MQLIFASLHSMEMISICNMIHSVKLNCHFIGKFLINSVLINTNKTTSIVEKTICRL